MRSQDPAAFELESESLDRGATRRLITWFDTSDGPLTLVCQYGRVLYPARGTSMLLVPLPARSRGECVVTSDLRAPRREGRMPTTSTCIGETR